MNIAQWNFRQSLLVALVAAFAYGSFILGRSDGRRSWSWYDPGWQVATAISLAHDADLDLRNQLENDPSRAQDQTARGARGEWYPLHEFLLPVLTVPFVMLLGTGGCLLFNYLAAVLLAVLLVRICVRELPGSASVTAALLTAFSPIFFEYSYSYSLDLFAALLLTIAFHQASSAHPLRAGFATGLAVFGRFANAAALPALLLTPWLFQASNQRLAGRTPLLNLLYMAAGGAPVLGALLVCNYLMFGHPLETSFHHWVRWENGELTLVNQAQQSFGRALLPGLGELLLHRQNGILATLPYLPLILFGIAPLWRANRGLAIYIALAFIGYSVLLAKYSTGFPGAIGNRYLLPCAALSAIPCSYGLRRTRLFSAPPGAGSDDHVAEKGR